MRTVQYGISVRYKLQNRYNLTQLQDSSGPARCQLTKILGIREV